MNPETGYEVYITDGEDLLTDEQEQQEEPEQTEQKTLTAEEKKEKLIREAIEKEKERLKVQKLFMKS